MEMLKKNEDELKLLGYKLYSKGMSTRDISDVFKEVFETNYSAQSISNITKGFQEHRITWQNRIIDSDYYFIYVDAIHTKIRRSTVSSEAVYVVIGLKTNLERDVLGIYPIPQESASGWLSVFEDLYRRGLKRFLMCIADGIPQLENSLNIVYPKALLQKCVVHKIRNIILKVRFTDKEYIADDLRQIFDLDNPNLTLKEGQKRIDSFLTKWMKRYPFLRNKFDQSIVHHYFEYLKFPVVIRRLIYTTNWIERLNKHVRKVEKNKNSFPNEDSAINLLYMAIMEFEEKVYRYKVSSFISSEDHLQIMLKTMYPSLDT
jgi:transposase-like protein